MPGPRAHPSSCPHGSGHGGGREGKSPRDLPARREPKLPATVGLSGSGAPSNLRARRGGDRRARRVRLARRRSDRLPLAGSPCGAPAAAGLPCDPPESVSPGAGPGFDLAASARSGRLRVRPCGLRRLPGVPRLALRPSSVLPAPSSPLGVSGTSSGLLASVLRLLGASRTIRAGTGHGQLGVSAGQSMNVQVMGLRRRVTNRNGS